MAVKLGKKIITNGSGVEAYRFIIQKDPKQDAQTYERGRAAEKSSHVGIEPPAERGSSSSKK